MAASTPRNDMPDFADQRTVDRISAENDTTIDALAIRFCPVAAVGQRRPQRGDGSTSAIQRPCARYRLSAELDAQLADLTETAEAYWQTRSIRLELMVARSVTLLDLTATWSRRQPFSLARRPRRRSGADPIPLPPTETAQTIRSN